MPGDSHRRNRRTDESTQPVQRQQRIIMEGEEAFARVRNEWLLPGRGDIPFVRLLDQALDGVNVVALDITIGKTHLPEVRRLDKQLGERIGRMVRSAAVELPDGTLHVPLRIALVIG
ncbi:MAG: hypothetical protein ACOH13_13505 [Flavobacteriales bacterium]